MTVEVKVFQPVIEAISHFLLDEPFDRRAAKAGRAEFDRCCPECSKISFKLTARQREHHDTFRAALVPTLKDHGLKVPGSNSVGETFEWIRVARDAIDKMVRSNGREVGQARHRLRREIMFARALLEHLIRKDGNQKEAAD